MDGQSLGQEPQELHRIVLHMLLMQPLNFCPFNLSGLTIPTFFPHDSKMLLLLSIQPIRQITRILDIFPFL